MPACLPAYYPHLSDARHPPGGVLERRRVEGPQVADLGQGAREGLHVVLHLYVEHVCIYIGRLRALASEIHMLCGLWIGDEEERDVL